MANLQPERCPTRALAAIAAILGLCIAAHAAQSYKVLFSFNGSNGYAPTAGVTISPEGDVYGATGNGGTGKCPNGCGVVFQLSRNAKGQWTETILHNFQGQPDGDGSAGNVTISPGGNLYGTTNYGGIHDRGTVFELIHGPEGWKETVIHSFCTVGYCPHIPEAGVTLGEEGALYGTAFSAYRLSLTQDGWKETTLYTFKNPHDGYDPFAGLVRDRKGSFYGTTLGGGNQCSSDSTCGTVYELSPQPDGRWKHTILFKFNGKDGQFPGPGALYMDKAGALYGTTEIGGVYAGVIFRLTPEQHGHWTYKILYDFRNGPQGNEPDAGVVMDKLGNLYGNTSGGGPFGCGVLYKLAPVGQDKWKYSVLHFFGKVGDGCGPSGNLVIDQHGNLYGSLILAGKYGYGVIFEYSTLASSR
jgi:uncharacterized repeat protein (TIGR03803 family)